MGKKKDLSGSEKQTIVQLLGQGKIAHEIAQSIHRDSRTVKRFIKDSNHTRKRSDKGKCKVISKRDITKIKRSVAKNPLNTSFRVFQEAGINGVSKSSRWRLLQRIATVKTAKRQPPLTIVHKVNRVKWAMKYLKTDFSNVLFTDECRATLDGPDGFARGWVLNGLDVPAYLRRQQGGGGVMFWAGLIGTELIGPFRVPDGVKMNSEGYTSFLHRHFVPWYLLLNQQSRERLIFMQDNAPSHASRHTRNFLGAMGLEGDIFMDWPPNSPDLNPIENYWGLFKAQLYSGGRQYANKDDLWRNIVQTFKSMSPLLPGRLTSTMDTRLATVLRKNGNYTFH